jgi:DNA-binding transcriptional ArsR family regulator
VNPRPPRQGTEHTLIDRIRHDLQERLEQLLAEADKLRRALAALDPREPTAKPATTPSTTPSPTTTATAAPKAPRRSASADTPQLRSGSRARTAPGETKAKVLSALNSNGGMTASEVASATGLSRGTASTTLSKLAKIGEVTKAQRGYRLPTQA